MNPFKTDWTRYRYDMNVNPCGWPHGQMRPGAGAFSFADRLPAGSPGNGQYGGDVFVRVDSAGYDDEYRACEYVNGCDFVFLGLTD